MCVDRCRRRDRINEGVRSVAPAVKRRSSDFLRHVAAAAIPVIEWAPGDSDATAGAGAGGTAGAPAAGKKAAVAPRRTSLIHVAMRSKAAAAAVAGSSYDDEYDAETGAQAIEWAMNVWNLEFHDPILETVGAFCFHNLRYCSFYRAWLSPTAAGGCFRCAWLMFPAVQEASGW